MARLSIILTFLCLAQWASETYSLGSGCSGPLKQGKQTDFWLSKIDHIHDQAPFNPNPKAYKVFRNVKDFGAKGDGTTDDTAAIQSAISSGDRCGDGCGESTTTPAIVYFPPGKYLMTKSVLMLYFTQMIGDPINPPTLLMAPGYSGSELGMLESDAYLSGGHEPFINQDNFYRQVRNFIIDVSQAPANKAATGIHWQVAQATSITNVHFKMSTAAGNRHRGIWMENGSGGYMSDLSFEGGEFALWVGNQQFTSRNLTIKGAKTAIYMNWNWGWTFKNLQISNCQVALEMTAGGAGAQGVGSVLIMDSQITDTPTGVLTHTSATSKPPGSGALILDNVKLTNVKAAVADGGKTILEGGSKTIASWGQGHVYDHTGKTAFHQGDLAPPAKPAVLLDSKNANKIFFERHKPQYEDVALSEFVSVVGEGAKGDGKADDTKAIADTIAKYAGCKIIYFPEGVYLISDTIHVPAGSRLIGEAWSVLSATGKAFADEANPKPMLEVGKPGDTGIAELSELVFSNHGSAPGAILVQINMKDPAGQQGAVGLFDSHFRVGGAKGAELDNKDLAVHTMLHLAPTSSAYLENVWAWVSDHNLDHQGQGNIMSARGILAESENGPVWGYGTASEHSVMYQYNIVNSKNLIFAMIQTETPYFQANPPAPKPFTTNAKFHDPDFSKCAAGSVTCPNAWGLRVVKSSDIFIYGAGLYNFFQDHKQGCLTDEHCQDAMVSVEQSPSKVYLYNLNTKAAETMVQVDGKNAVMQKDNRASFCSTIAAFMDKI